MSIENFKLPEGLDPKTQKEFLKLAEEKPNSPVTLYLNSLSAEDLRKLDMVLNMNGDSFYSLNIYEGEEAERARDVLKRIVAEADGAKHKEMLKLLP